MLRARETTPYVIEAGCSTPGRDLGRQAALADSPETLRALEECGLPLTQAVELAREQKRL